MPMSSKNLTFVPWARPQIIKPVAMTKAML